MISRAEFYASFIVLIMVIGFASYVNLYDPKADEETARIEAQDSIILVQRDSAFSRALKFELRSDSFEAIANRRNLDLNIIRKKTQDEKKNVLVLGADSTLSFFLSTTGGN